jgi:hypothetical protein
MIIFWRGFGFLPLVILALVGLLVAVLGFDITRNAVVGTVMIIAGVLTGVACVILQAQDSRNRNGGHDLISTPHTLMFIPMIFWCPLFICIGVFQF